MTDVGGEIHLRQMFSFDVELHTTLMQHLGASETTDAVGHLVGT
jgi:hypothetical protein